MNSFALRGALLAAALLLAGCAKNIDNAEAVKQGIIKDIGKKVDVQNMDVFVDAVSFRSKEATATVSFSPKGVGRQNSITMQYNMVRQGDEWHVKDRNMARHEQSTPPAGANGMTGSAPPITPGTPLPPGHPPMSTAAGSAGDASGLQVPIPHPVTGAGPIPAGTTQLPAGHPPLGAQPPSR